MESLPRTLEIREWHTPATDYPIRTVRNFRLTRTRQWYGHYKYWGMDGNLFYRVRKPIPITSLQEKRGRGWHPWMVDDPPQQRAMEIYAEHCEGKVLVAGLGLGLILHELAKNPKIEYVCVVEKSPEVMALVMPSLMHLLEPEKGKCLFAITREDFFDFIRNNKGDWDHIIVDLWVSHGKDQKTELLFHEVLPTLGELLVRYPNTPITFHGFQSVSTIKPVSKEMEEVIHKLEVY